MDERRVSLQMFANVLVWHCSKHRSELAATNVIREINESDHMKRFSDKFYNLYSDCIKCYIGSHRCSVITKPSFSDIETDSDDPNRDSREKATYMYIK
jgi:hypothetical protein